MSRRSESSDGYGPDHAYECIRLAEAMGWKRGEIHRNTIMGRTIEAQRWIDPDGKDRAPSAVPDPFTDANDDYAVLEWMREQGWLGTAGKARRTFLSRTMLDYEVGDYARAALTVLGERNGSTT